MRELRVTLEKGVWNRGQGVDNEPRDHFHQILCIESSLVEDFCFNMYSGSRETVNEK